MSPDRPCSELEGPAPIQAERMAAPMRSSRAFSSSSARSPSSGSGAPLASGHHHRPVCSRHAAPAVASCQQSQLLVAAEVPHPWLQPIGARHHSHTSRRSSVRAFATVKQQGQQQQQQQAGQERDRTKGRMTYLPQSFSELVQDAVLSVKDGIRDGFTRMEVEFPPVPTKIDGYKGASDLFIDSNIQLALAAARQLAESGRRVHVLMPDQGEYDRAYKLFKSSLGLLGDGVSLGHLKERGGWNWSVEGIFNGFAPDSKEVGEKADTYLMINATCIELLNVREYTEQLAPPGSGKVVVLWNLELDSLRGDLGLPAFPSKEVHHAFLSTFRPVFYLRPRDYSKSVPVPPYLVNYSGALFREYPGPWQVMLRQDTGEYACIAEDKVRYNLGEVKEELQAAMGLNTEEEGSALQTLRRGLKNSTWWEDDYDTEKSHEWRL